MKTLITLFFYIYFSLQLNGQTWKNYSTGDIVYDVFKDGNEIWISTYGGLIKTNLETEERRIYRGANSPLHGTRSEMVRKAPDGTIWIAGTNGGLFHIREDEQWDNFYKMPDGTLIEKVDGIDFNPNGKIWFLAEGQIYTIENNQFFRHNENVADALTEAFFSTNKLIVDNEGIFWGKKNSKIFSYDGNTITSIFDSSNSPILESGFIESIHADKSGRIWFSQKKANGKYNHFLIENEECLLLSDLEQFQDNKIFKVTNSSDDKIVLNLGIKILVEYDGQNFQNLFFEDWSGLPEEFYEQFPRLAHIDHEEYYWFIVGLRDGTNLLKYKNEQWEAIDTKIDGIVSNSKNSFEFDCDGNLWVGNTFPILEKFDGQNWTNLNEEIRALNLYGSTNSVSLNKRTCDIWCTKNGSPGDSIGLIQYTGEEIITHKFSSYAYKVETDLKGNTWVTTGLEGVGKFDGQNWEWFNRSNSPVYIEFSDIVADNHNRIWIVTSFGDVFIYHENDWTEIKLDSLRGQNLKISINNTNEVFLNNNDLILKWNGIEFQDLGIPKEITELTYLSFDKDNNFWIGTKNGLYFWDGGSNLEHYHIRNSGLLNNWIQEIEFDKYGKIWTRHFQGGISVFDKNEITDNKKEPKLTLYPNPSNGLINLSVENVTPNDRIKIFNMTGHLVYENICKPFFNLNLISGIYFVLLEQKGENSWQKLIIQK